MRILHYALGFPPYRSGGLTQFCVDLMRQQEKQGHTVGLLWPGQMGFVKKRVSIKDQGMVLIKNSKVQSFEVINPLPVSLDEGISDFQAFMSDAPERVYSDFLSMYAPEVIHVHTLMGLHKSFLMAAKNKGIRIVFTAHDFFPICPKVTMFRKGKICACAQTFTECGACNATALDIRKIQILQSPIYRKLKDAKLIKKLRKQHRDSYLSEASSEKQTVCVGDAADFSRIRKYYESMLRLVDIVHYNSTVTKSVYESFFEIPSSCVISITHENIADNKQIKKFQNDKLRIRYLGPMGGAKGFFLLKAALDKLWTKRNDFCLDVHFSPTELSPYMQVHGRYTYEDLERIFRDSDVLVAPSIWYETFGYTVLEALSYGVPVIISDTVGAKDILVDGAGIIIPDIDADKLCTAINSLTADKLKNMNQIILEKQNIMSISEMAKHIQARCYPG